MVKNHTICNIEVVDKQSKLLLEEIMEMCSELSPRIATSYLKDDKGAYRFLKGTRTTVKGDFLVDMNTYDEDVVLDKYCSNLCKSCRVICRVDLDNPRLNDLYNRCYETIRKTLTGADSLEEKEIIESNEVAMDVISSENSSNRINSGPSIGLLGDMNPSTVFSGMLDRRNTEEKMLEDFAIQLEAKVNEIMYFIDENKFKVDKKQIENVIKRLDYSSDILKSVLNGLNS